MDDDAVQFASLLCSRLCHDLLSPVGSFGNGLELLADEPDGDLRERCLGLLESSATTAINRLKYFRLAFGSSGGFGDTIAVEDILAAVRGLVSETRQVTVNWIGGDGAVDKPAARVLLALAMIVVDALVRGGTVDIAVEQRGPILELALRGHGERVVIDTESEGFFADANAEPSPRTIGIALARRIARASGGDVMLSRPDGAIVVGALLGSAGRQS